MAGAKPHIRLRRDPYLVRVSLRPGVVLTRGRFAAVVLWHAWWDKPRWKLLAGGGGLK